MIKNRLRISDSSDRENDAKLQLLSKFHAASLATITTRTYNSILKNISAPHDQVARINKLVQVI